MSDNKPNLDSLFLAASEIESEAQRAAFLADACGDDLDLRKQIEQLLQSDQQAGSFLEKTAPGLEETIVPNASKENRAASLDASLAPVFSASDAVVIGDANHSVLKMIGNTLNEVPRVALRESAADGADPITRPASPEIPHHDSNSRYQLQGEIARGGMGAIIKGRDTDLGRELAIKVLLDSHKDKPEVANAERKRAEAESARANEEHKRRRISLMLAASVLLLVGLGSGGWLYLERQEANRQTAEADAQRAHAVEMQALAEQRDDQRKAAELARNVAVTAQHQADTEKMNSLNMLADMQLTFLMGAVN